MKRIVVLLFVLLITLIITGCGNESDANKFKKEYEKLNGEKVEGTNYKYLSLSIPKDNNIVYKTDTEIVDIIKNGTGVIYFGFSNCPWCRSMINNLLDVTSDLGISQVYYVDVSSIRDTLEFYEDGSIVRSNGGTIAYNELLDLLDEHLDYYVIYDKDNNPFETTEKRIYAPSVVVVKEGKVLGLTTGVSDDLENPFDEISDNLKKESYDMLYNLIKEIKPVNACVDGGSC